MATPTLRPSVVIPASLAAGLATTALLWRADIGLSWLVTVILFVAGALWTQRRTRVTNLGAFWGACAIWLALCLCWRASTWTLSIAYPASLFMVVTLPLILRQRLGWRDLGDLPALTGAWMIGAFPAMSAASRMIRPRDGRTSRRVVGGLLLGLPVSVTITVLLSANPRFRAATTEILDGGSDPWIFACWTLATAATYLVGALALDRIHCGVFDALRRPAFLGHIIHVDPVATTTGESPYRTAEHSDNAVQRIPRSLSPVTWTLVLAQLLVVFGLFVAVNLGDFFGGHALVRSEGTTTYAEYLHAGFAEVTIASLITVGVVMFGHCVVAAPTRREQKWSFAGLEVLLLALTAVTLASCWQRTTIYMDAYGYTHLRLGVVLVQLGVLGLLGLTMVRAIFRSWTGQPAAVVALPVLLALGASTFNADLFVARANLRRLVEAPETATSTGLDERYLEGLTVDALPALDDEHVPADLADDLRRVWTDRALWLTTGDWRGRRALGFDPPARSASEP